MWWRSFDLLMSKYIFLFSSLKFCLVHAYILKNYNLHILVKVTVIKKSVIHSPIPLIRLEINIKMCFCILWHALSHDGILKMCYEIICMSDCFTRIKWIGKPRWYRLVIDSLSCNGKLRNLIRWEAITVGFIVTGITRRQVKQEEHDGNRILSTQWVIS